MKFIVNDGSKEILSRIEAISKSRELKYLIYPSQPEDSVSIGIIKTGHSGGLFFQGTIVYENEHNYLVGDFVNTSTIDKEIIKKSKGEFIAYAMIYSVIALVVSIFLFLAWIPLYFIIGKPWWIPAIIIITVFLSASLYYASKSNYLLKKRRINFYKKLGFLKKQFVDMLVNDLKFQIVDNQ